MTNMTPDVEMSLAIVIRSVLEHTDPDSPLGRHAEAVDRWMGERMRGQGTVEWLQSEFVRDAIAKNTRRKGQWV